MMVIDLKLKEREAAGNPIQVGILGAGEMSIGLVNQIERYTPGMRTAAIYNRTPEKAVHAYATAGVDSTGTAANGAALDDAISAGKAVTVESPEILWAADKIDVVVEMTGTIQLAFDWIMQAMAAGKHVVSFNAELDATVGPYLQMKSRESGVRYTLGDGDQPGVTLNLYRQVKLMGFNPLVCGNIKGMLDHYRTPETQKKFAEENGLSVNMVTSFADGTKVSLEQAAIANATGMQVARRGMLAFEYDGQVDDLTSRYDIDQLKELGGIVEMVIGGKPGPGVFVFASTDDPVSERFLAYGKLGKGPLYSFYIPYHLLFFELPFSIVRLVDFADGTVDSMDGFKVEVITTAKRDLQAGETLDGLGGFCHYGECENTPVVRQENLLPVALAEGKTLIRDIAQDTAISWADVAERKPDPIEVAYRSIRLK
jgi:predicted homoserine dehydrogenase-like protein